MKKNILFQLFGVFCFIIALGTQSLIGGTYFYIENSNKRIPFLTQRANYKDSPTTVFVTQGTESRLYKWEKSWRLPQADEGGFSFHSQLGLGEVFIGLGASGESEELGAIPRYELNIRQGTGTYILKNGRESRVLAKHTPGIIPDTGTKELWVSYKQGVIAAGVGTVIGRNKFMEWTDTDAPHAGIEYFSFWRYGASDIFSKIVPSPWQDDPTTYLASGLYNSYRSWRNDWLLPELNKGAVTFLAKNITTPENSATIQVGFASEETTGQQDAEYDVLIGGWNNTQSGIRKKRQLVAKSTTDNARVPVDGEFQAYWIMINNGIISFGTGTTVGSNEIRSWKDPDAANVTIRKVSFSSYTNTVEFRDITFIPAVDNNLFTAVGLNSQFPEWRGAWKFPEPNSGAVVFSAQNIDLKDENTTLNIGLNSVPGTANPPYVIYLGGWKNTKSALIKDRLTVASSDGDSGKIPADKEPHTYWVSVNGPTIAYGKGSEVGRNMIGTYDDLDGLPIQFFSFSSLDNSVKYEIKSVESYSVSVAQKVTSMNSISELEKITKLEDIITQKRLNKITFSDSDYTTFIGALEGLVATRDLLDAGGIEKLQRVINIAYYDPAGFFNVEERAQKLSGLYKETTLPIDLEKQIAIYGTELTKALALKSDDPERAKIFVRISSLSRSTDELLLPFLAALLDTLVKPLSLDASGLTVTEKATVEPFIAKINALYLTENSVAKKLEALEVAVIADPKEAPTKWLSTMESIKATIMSTSGMPAADKNTYALELKKGALYREAFNAEQLATLKSSIEMSRYANSNGTLVFAEQQAILGEATTALTSEKKLIADRVTEYAELLVSANYSSLIFAGLVKLLTSEDAKSLDSSTATIFDTKIITPLSIKATSDAQRAMIEEMKQSLAVVKQQTGTFKYHFAQIKEEKDRTMYVTRLTGLIDDNTITFEDGDHSVFVTELDFAAKIADVIPTAEAALALPDYTARVRSLVDRVRFMKGFENEAGRITIISNQLATPFDPKVYTARHTALMPGIYSEKTSNPGKASRYYSALKEHAAQFSLIPEVTLAHEDAVNALAAFANSVTAQSALSYEDSIMQANLSVYKSAINDLAARAKNAKEKNDSAQATQVTQGTVPQVVHSPTSSAAPVVRSTGSFGVYNPRVTTARRR